MIPHLWECPDKRRSAASPNIQAYSIKRKKKGKDFLEQEYVQNQRSVRDIAKGLGCSHSTILANLKRFGIPIRDAIPNNYKRGQVAYGKRKLRSREVEHKRELEVLAKIQHLRSQGFSNWKIADVLNTMGIPTKTRRAKWQAPTAV